jgi:hypothetical protein
VRWIALPPAPSPSVLERFFAKKVSLWLVAVIVLFFSLGTVAFAWYVKRSAGLGDEHPLAQAAVKVASFPGDVKDVALELHLLILGKPDYGDVRATPSEKQWSDFAPLRPGSRTRSMA